MAVEGVTMMRVEIIASNGASVTTECKDMGFNPDIVDSLKNKAIEAFAALMTLDITGDTILLDDGDE